MKAVTFVLSRLTRDRSALLGLLLIAALVAAALLAPLLATHPDDVFELHPAERLRAPGSAHWLGTDRMGADVYSRRDARYWAAANARGPVKTQ
jgi:peptide/nickel transport system permease protein